MKFTTVLKKYLAGEVDVRELKDSDDLIYEVKTLGTKHKTKIVIWFDSLTEFFELFDLSEYEISDITWNLNTRNHYEYLFSSDDVDYDWREGRVFRTFNEENLETLKKIFTLIGPQYLDNFDFVDDSKNTAMAELLETYDKKNIISNYILDRYQEILSTSMEESLQKAIEDDYCDILQQFVIIRTGNCFEKYMTSTGVLYSLYERYGNNEELTLAELLKKFTKNLSVYGEYERYEVWDGEFDIGGYNDYIKDKLEDLYDYIFDNYEFSHEFVSTVQNLSTNFGFNKFFDVPGKPIKIKINSVDIDDMTISITIENTKTGKIKDYSPDIQTFMSYLYNLDLFDLGEV